MEHLVTNPEVHEPQLVVSYVPAAIEAVEKFNQRQLGSAVIESSADNRQRLAVLNDDLKAALGRDFDMFGEDVYVSVRGGRRFVTGQLVNPRIVEEGDNKMIIADARLQGSTASIMRCNLLAVKSANLDE